MSAEIKSTDQLIRAKLIEETNLLLSECTEKQVAFFHRVQNGAPWRGFENCPTDQMKSAYELVRRTVIKNREAADA